MTRDKFSKWADPALLKRLVVELHDDMEKTGKRPGAEFHTTSEDGRKALVGAIRMRWREAVGNPPQASFPWSADFIIWTWLFLRKKGQEAKQRWKAAS